MFWFLIKHLHICYKFSYRTSNLEIHSAMLYQKLSPNFLIFYANLTISRKNPILGNIFKVVNSRYKNCVIFTSQINLSPFGPISESDWCPVAFVFLFKFLFCWYFCNCLSIQSLGENRFHCYRLRRHTA